VIVLKELYIDNGITQSRAAVYVDGRLDDLYVENHDDASISGNIYKGRIENIVPGLNAAFVNIGIGKNAILHFKSQNESSNYRRGNDILVQVVREASGDKGPRVSDEISIPGKYIVLLPGINRVYISQKINDESIVKSLNLLSKEFVEEGFGVIFRTEAEDVNRDIIVSEYYYLRDLWNVIQKKINYIKPPEAVFNSRDFLNYITREFIKSDVDKIYVNRDRDRDYILTLLSKVNPEINKIVEYQGKNFGMINNLSADIIDLLERKKTLKSGGYIVFDYTEACTAIDVNTGSYIGNENKESTVLTTNLEASSEIYRYIKMMNLSGIIVIDFINMNSEKSRNEIIESLKEKFNSDRVSSSVYGFTNLGLLEISRAKKGKPLHKLVYNEIYSSKYDSSYLLKEIENKCLRYSKHYNKINFDAFVQSGLYEDIQAFYKDFNTEMKRLYGLNINFIKSDSVNGYELDRENREDRVSILIGEKKINGQLLTYSEESNGEILIKIKKR
jgi:ribonuclease G